MADNSTKPALRTLNSPLADFAKSLPSISIGGFTVALAGSLWALLGSGDCYSCSEAARAVGKLPLAAAGVAAYAVLLALALFGRRPVARLAVLLGALAAAGVHLALISTLAESHLYCPPCVLVACGAFAAALAALWENRGRRAVLAIIIVPVAALGMHGIVRLSFRAMMERDLADALRAAAQVRDSETAVPSGRVRLVFFTQPNCHYCEVLKAEDLPTLRREFGPALETEERRATPRLSTPTIVILGARGAVFGGLPPEADLARAIHHALGDPDSSVPSTGLPF